MQLTDEQMSILKVCATPKSDAIPTMWYQGKQYLISSKDQCDDLLIEGNVVGPLIGKYLELAKGKDVYRLTKEAWTLINNESNEAHDEKGVQEK